MDHTSKHLAAPCISIQKFDAPQISSCVNSCCPQDLPHRIPQTVLSVWLEVCHFLLLLVWISMLRSAVLTQPPLMQSHQGTKQASTKEKPAF